MNSNRVFKIAFVISIIGHGLCLGLPAVRIDAVQNKEEKDIEFQIEIEKPQLIPKIDKRGYQKKYKEVKKAEELQNPKVEDKNPAREEVVKKEEFVFEKDIVKQEQVEKVHVKEPDEEAMLRYQDMIKQRIQEERHYPRWAKKQELEGYVDVSFVVLSDGTIKNEMIMLTSGVKVFDEESLSTIRRAAPFPPIPSKTIKQTQMQVRIVFGLK